MPKILLVDDQEELRLLLQATLEDADYEILEAQSGSEALSIARAELPSLVVMDWMMPGMSGVDVVRALKADPATRAIPVILLTARSQAEDRQAGISAGASAFLSKPFSPLELVRQVESLLASSQIE
ncbi:MAG: response regulator [Acidobacteriia bacterium]|nr:response regulator [Terriglobia bacterium]